MSRVVTKAKQTPNGRASLHFRPHPRGVEVSSPAPSTLASMMDGGKRSNFPSKAALVGMWELAWAPRARKTVSISSSEC